MNNLVTINVIEALAKAAHESTKELCELYGDMSQPAWADLSLELRESVLIGIRAALTGATPRQLHELWVKTRTEAGWVFGPIKDMAAKTHPCLVPYDDLPVEQRVKDTLFAAHAKGVIAMLQSLVGQS